MNNFLIKKYINQLTKQDIYQFLNSQNLSLTEQEINIIYYYLKNKSNYFLEGHQQEILNELKIKLSPNTFKIILEYYQKYQNKI